MTSVARNSERFLRPSATILQGYPALPGNKIRLHFQLRFGADVARRDAKYFIEQRPAHFFDGFLAADNSSSIKIDDVVHAPGQLGVSGNFYDRRDGIPRWRAEARSEQNNVRSRAYLCGNG